MRGGILVKCDESVQYGNQPQDMYLQEGMELLCACKAHPTLVNGVFYAVEGVDHQHVVVRMVDRYKRPRETLDEKAVAKADKQEGAVTLSHKEASLALRLTYALCYASVQGLTISNKKVLMLDLDHANFDMRTLIVGVSRLTSGKDLFIATEEQEKVLLARTKNVPLPSKVVAVAEDSDSDEE